MSRAHEVANRPSILDLAKKGGWSSAVILDDSITAASSAAFLVEHENRDENALSAGKLVDQLRYTSVGITCSARTRRQE
jgi:hypothetical protein